VSLQCALHAPEIRIRVEVRDEEDVDIRGPKVLWHGGALVAGQHLWHQAAEDDELDVLVTDLMNQEREASRRTRS
jgi:hypothetical protein